VIEVSTSPLGEIGGFQIIPSQHAQEMGYVFSKKQWLIIGPASDKAPPLEGSAPFFKYFIQPRFTEHDLISAGWEEALLDRFLAEVKYEGEDNWKPMPVLSINAFYLTRNLPAWTNACLENVTHIRILFPIEG
jgi:hypothetical protein